MHLSLTALRRGFLHCFYLCTWGAVQDSCHGRGMWLVTRKMRLRRGIWWFHFSDLFQCRGCQWLGITQCKEVSMQGLNATYSMQGCSRRCLLWDVWSVMSCSGSPAARPVQTCWQEVLELQDRVIDTVPAAANLVPSITNKFAHLSPYCIRSVLPWKSVCEV